MTGAKKSKLADFALLLVAFLWGGGFIAVKDSLDTISPMYLLTIRMGLASATFLFIFPKIRGITKQDVIKTLPAAIALYSGFALQTTGLQYTDVSKQGFLTATYVVFVPIVLWVFYRKKPKPKVFIGCFIVLVGIALTGLSKQFSLNYGDSLTLLCAVCFAFHIIFTDFAVQSVDVFKFSFLQFSIACAFFFVSALIFEQPPAVPTFRSAMVLLYMAVFATFLCFVMQTAAQKYTSPSRASIFLSLESVFAAVMGVMMLGEELTVRKVIGFVLIFFAVLLIEVDWKEIFSLKNQR